MRACSAQTHKDGQSEITSINYLNYENTQFHVNSPSLYNLNFNYVMDSPCNNIVRLCCWGWWVRSIFNNGKVSDAIEVERCQMLDNEAVTLPRSCCWQGKCHVNDCYTCRLYNIVFSNCSVNRLCQSSRQKFRRKLDVVQNNQ